MGTLFLIFVAYVIYSYARFLIEDPIEREEKMRNKLK